jgi:hypothetical protein
MNMGITVTMGTPTSQDAAEVAQVLSDKLKPYRAFVLGVMGLLSAGAVRVYDLGVFVEKTKAHEDQQDENLMKLKEMMDTHEKQGHRVHELSDKQIIEILVNDLALLRAVQLETLPRHRRESIRRQFEAQRMAEIKLLAGRRTED